MPGVLDDPISTAEPAYERPRTYEGHLQAMEVLNRGNEELYHFAVSLQLKANEAGLPPRIFFGLSDERQIVSPAYPESISPENKAALVCLEMRGDSLVIRFGDEEQMFHKEDLLSYPVTVSLDETTGLEVIDFDPAKQHVVVQRITLIHEIPVKTNIPGLVLPTSNDALSYDGTRAFYVRPIRLTPADKKIYAGADHATENTITASDLTNQYQNGAA